MILNQFKHHRKERDLIGQILLAYGELEILLWTCLPPLSMTTI
jgi:hypothetical protein